MNGHATDVDHLPGILPHHLAELRASGLTNDTIRAAGIYSEAAYDRVARLLNWTRIPKKMLPGIVFPFIGPDGERSYSRVKPDNPRKRARNLVKYESPSGRTNEPYVPASVWPLFDKPDVTLYLTEGEKKSLCATQYGFPCIGFVGDWGWKSGKAERLLPALERINFKGRKVYVAYDSDAVRNDDVRAAESRLAAQLSSRGANVLIVRLPDGPPGADGNPQKVGLDDYLVAHGADALHRLVSTAEAPEEIENIEMRGAAKEIDPATEVRLYLEAEMQDGVCRLARWCGSFYRWEKGRYIELSKEFVRAAIVNHVNKNFHSLSCSITSNLLDQLVAQSIVSPNSEMPSWRGDPPADWAPEEVLACRNTLVHLPSLIAAQPCKIPPTPRFFSTVALNYDFADAPPRPDAWLDFLEQVWPGDVESPALLQEWAGYLLTQDTRQQKILMMVGPIRSGKGTIAPLFIALRRLRLVSLDRLYHWLDIEQECLYGIDDASMEQGNILGLKSEWIMVELAAKGYRPKRRDVGLFRRNGYPNA